MNYMKIGSKMYNNEGAIIRITSFNMNRVKVISNNEVFNISSDKLCTFKTIKPHCWFRIFLIHSKDNTIEMVVTFFNKKSKKRSFRIRMQNKCIEINDDFHHTDMYDNTMTGSYLITGSKIELFCYIDDNEYSLRNLLLNTKFKEYIEYIENKLEIDFNKILKIFINKIDNLFSIWSIEIKGASKEATSIDPYPELVDKLESLEGYKLQNIFIIPYWYDVRLKYIKNDYIFIRDLKSRILFIANFITKEPLDSDAMTEYEIHKFLRY